MLSQHVNILNTLKISIDFSIAIDQNESVCQDNHLYSITSAKHISEMYITATRLGPTVISAFYRGLIIISPADVDIHCLSDKNKNGHRLDMAM